MKINKKIMTLVLCSSFAILSASSGLVSLADETAKAKDKVEQVSNQTVGEGEKDDLTNSDEVKLAIDSDYIEKVEMPDSKSLKIKLNPNKTGDGYLVLAVSENACKFKRDKKPLELTLNNDGKEYKTIVLRDYASYKTRINKKDMYEFYIPAPKLQGNMELVLTDPNEEASIEEEFSIAAYSHNIGEDKLVAAPKYEDIGNNKIKATGSYEDEIVYEGFIFGNVDGKNQESLFIRPSTGNRRIKLKLGTYKDDVFSYTSSNDRNNKFRVRYYDTEKTYEDIEANGIKNSKGKDRYSKDQYVDEKVTVGESNSINLPFLPEHGIIRIDLDEANTFLLNLSVEGTSNPGNVNGGGSTGGETQKPEEKPDINSNVKRYSGDNRYFTSIKLSEEAYSSSDVAVVASGENFADALSGGALASINDAPLLLVNGASTDSVKRELDRLGVEKLYILGGKNSISDDIEYKLAKDKDRNLRNVQRLSGDNRYKTSIAVYRELIKSSDSNINPVLVNGNQFADALSAGPIAARDKRAIVLTDGHNVDSMIDKKSDKNIVVGGYNSMDNSFDGYRYSGRDRYDTSAKIAKSFNEPEKALLASGEKYPDGLSAITLYSKHEGPLLLTQKDTLPREVKNYFSSEKIDNLYIIGGTNSVSKNVERLFNK